MKIFEIWTLVEYGMFDESIFSPLFLITELDGDTVVGKPLFFGDTTASDKDIKLELATSQYKNIWVDSTALTIHRNSCHKKIVTLDNKTIDDFLRTLSGETVLSRGRLTLPDGIDPLEKLKNEMQIFFHKYAEKSIAQAQQNSLPEMIRKGIKELFTFDTVELVMQQAAGGNRVESRIIEQNNIEIFYAVERRFDQDGDLVISINGRAHIENSNNFRILLVLAEKNDKELFRKEIVIKNNHFEEYYYRDELTNHTLNPEDVMEKLEKGDLRCYLIIDSGLKE